MNYPPLAFFWDGAEKFDSPEIQPNQEKCSCSMYSSLSTMVDFAWKHETATIFPAEEPAAEPYLMCQHKREIVFHPNFSSGTLAICGDTLFVGNNYYFFEVAIWTKLQGTDTLIGLGTENFDLTKFNSKYKSYLGSDEFSWGFSCKGYIQHGNYRKSYGRPFGAGDIVGVSVNMCNYTVEYFINRVPQGIAFKLDAKTPLLPIVSSTTKGAAITLLSSRIRQGNLQSRCLQKLNETPQLCAQYAKDYRFLFRNLPFWLKPIETAPSATCGEISWIQPTWDD